MLTRLAIRNTSHLAPSNITRVSARCMTASAVSQSDYQTLRTLGANHLNKGVGRITDGIMVKGEGSYVKYDDGRKYLDFTCGIGVTNLGTSSRILVLVLP
jgi:4-aminobutyrate aminotransferase